MNAPIVDWGQPFPLVEEMERRAEALAADHTAMTLALAEAAVFCDLADEEIREQCSRRRSAETQAKRAEAMEQAAKLAAGALLERLQRLEAAAAELCEDVERDGADGRRRKLACNVRRAILGI